MPSFARRLSRAQIDAIANLGEFGEEPPDLGRLLGTGEVIGAKYGLHAT